eukprot:2530725-Karenia_brevis.AAC.1
MQGLNPLLITPQHQQAMQALSSVSQQHLMEVVNHLQGLQGLVSQMQFPLTHGSPPTDNPDSQPPPTLHTPPIRPKLWRQEAAFNRGVQPSGGAPPIGPQGRTP